SGATYSDPVAAGTNFTNVFSILGSNTWTVYCNDSAGNLNQTNVTFSVYISYPSVSWVYPANGSINKTSYNITIEITNSSDAVYTWWQNGTDNLTYTGTTYINLSDGNYTFFAYANDTHGDVNQSRVDFEISVDFTPPYIAFISPSNGTTYNSSLIIVNITNSSDAVYTWWQNGTDNLTYTGPISYNFSEGSNTIFAYANDSWNNVNQSRVDFEVASLITYTGINITSLINNQEVVRGGGVSGEDSLGLVANDLNITSRVYSISGGQGINASACYFYDNGILLGSSLTNNSGDCLISIDKTTRAVGIREISVNYTNASSTHIGLINDSRKNITLVAYVTTLAMNNRRLVGGELKYYDGDIGILSFNITKSNGTDTVDYDAQNITAAAMTSEDVVRGVSYYPGNVTRTAPGRFLANVTINFTLNDFIKWEVNFSNNSYSDTFGSALHSDVGICAADFGAWSDWSTCTNDLQTRTRTDSSGCQETQSQSCTSGDDDSGGDDSGCDACSPAGYESRTCQNLTTYFVRICGDYNGDGCLEYSSSIYVNCQAGEICENGQCGSGIYFEECQFNCTPWSECSYVGDEEAASLVGSFFLSLYKIDQEFLPGMISQKKVSDGFTGEYYNNKNLQGKPVLTRDDSEINFNWNKDSPDKKVNRNQFSVRWTKDETFEAGKYRFRTTTDDGVKLYIDGSLVINKWRNQAAKVYTVDVELDSGEHEIRMEYYENNGKAVARLAWETLELYEEGYCAGGISPNTCIGETPLYCKNGVLIDNCNVCGCESFESCQVNGECKLDISKFKGFVGEYYNNKDLQGEPVLIRDDSKIYFNWKSKSPSKEVAKDRFSVRWIKDEIFEAGKYKFTVGSDDGIRVYVDGKLIIERWNNHPLRIDTAEIDLTGGEHKIKVEYYENSGKAVVKLSWELVELFVEVVCADGTKEGECSASQGRLCQNGTLVDSCEVCSCNEGYECKDSKCDEIFLVSDVCGDGTNYGECSTQKPKFCQNGTLISNCSICGCSDGAICEQNGTCSEIPITEFELKCSDGTNYGECSTQKPKFCQNGTLISNCQLCGCYSGQQCKTNGTCEDLTVKQFQETNNTGWVQTRTCSKVSGNNSCVWPVEARYCQPGCNEDWTCGSWGECMNNSQARECFDSNNCGTVNSKPNETAYCDIGGLIVNYLPAILDLRIYNATTIDFEASITDTSILQEYPLINATWYLNGRAVGGDTARRYLGSTHSRSFIEDSQVRLVVFTKYQTVTITWNIIIVEPVLNCTENWQCAWSSCDESGFSYPFNCVDLSDCSTTMNLPSKRTCACVPKWDCGEWSGCFADYSANEIIGENLVAVGRQERVCYDLEGCEPSSVQTRSCDSRVPIRVEKVEWCGEPYIEIYELGTDELVSRIKGARLENILRIDIGFVSGDFSDYCDYCYDGVKNYDETGIDCGGDNCPQCRELVVRFDWWKYIVLALWWLLLLLILMYIIYMYYSYKERKEDRIRVVKIKKGIKARFRWWWFAFRRKREEDKVRGKPGRRAVSGIRKKLRNKAYLSRVRRHEKRKQKLELKAARKIIRASRKENRKERRSARREVRAIKKRIRKRQIPSTEILQLRKQLKEWRKKGYYGTADLQKRLDELEKK
ncbi:MAG: PA14 domain-containing protein, partial [archaeon]